VLSAGIAGCRGWVTCAGRECCLLWMKGDWVLSAGCWVQGCERRVQGRVLRAADEGDLGDMCGMCWVQEDRCRLQGVSRHHFHVGYWRGLF
jgi:hypothetical protein